MILIPDILSNFSCHSPEESIIKVLYFLFLSYFLREFIEFITASTVAILDKKVTNKIISFKFFKIIQFNHIKIFNISFLSISGKKRYPMG